MALEHENIEWNQGCHWGGFGFNLMSWFGLCLLTGRSTATASF